MAAAIYGIDRCFGSDLWQLQERSMAAAGGDMCGCGGCASCGEDSMLGSETWAHAASGAAAEPDAANAGIIRAM